MRVPVLLEAQRNLSKPLFILGTVLEGYERTKEEIKKKEREGEESESARERETALTAPTCLMFTLMNWQDL